MLRTLHLERGHALSCDRCMLAEGPVGETGEEAVDLAHAAGWRRGEWEARPHWRRLGDLCPACVQVVETKLAHQRAVQKESIG